MEFPLIHSLASRFEEAIEQFTRTSSKICPSSQSTFSIFLMASKRWDGSKS